MWKEAVLAWFERLYHSLPEGIEGTRENMRLLIRQAEISTWIRQIRNANRSANHICSPHFMIFKA
jgi:hypothetical protein